MTYKIYTIADDDGFTMYAVVNAANDVIVETFYTRWDAEDFVAAETA
jgi:hypothetical protein